MAKTHVDYRKPTGISKVEFTKAYTAQFQNVPKYNAPSIQDLLQMIDMVVQDPAIADIRWMAYMLATTFIESSQTVKIKRTSKDKRGHAVVRTAKVWRNFSPIEEKGHGHGLAYAAPVKIKSLPDGSVRVTEQDGDQWLVPVLGGKPRPLSDLPSRGVEPLGKASPTYAKDDGDEKAYFGRGFVQLTWWSNYADTGFMIGCGLDLLLDPDLVEDPDTAYEIISTGMLTGKGFANGYTFREFFHGQHTDYVHARRMVNGLSHAREIGGIAERFERVIRAAAIAPAPVAKL